MKTIIIYDKYPQLNENEEVDVEVNWEDQQNINLFSTLNIKLENYEAEYEKVKVYSNSIKIK